VAPFVPQHDWDTCFAFARGVAETIAHEDPKRYSTSLAKAGREDKTINGGKWDLEGQRELEQADSGYRNELGTRTDYQAGYRAGFRVGYREGFGPR